MTPGTESLTDPLALLGTWSMTRVIDDRSLGQVSRIDGRLELTPVAEDRIRWEERGTWHQPHGDVQVSRDLWLVRTDPEQWWVRFEDGRDFHPWLPGEVVVHPCAPDTYRGAVRGDRDRWSVQWEVTGPRKDYTVTSELVREG